MGNRGSKKTNNRKTHKKNQHQHQHHSIETRHIYTNKHQDDYNGYMGDEAANNQQGKRHHNGTKRKLMPIFPFPRKRNDRKYSSFNKKNHEQYLLDEKDSQASKDNNTKNYKQVQQYSNDHKEKLTEHEQRQIYHQHAPSGQTTNYRHDQQYDGNKNHPTIYQCQRQYYHDKAYSINYPNGQAYYSDSKGNNESLYKPGAQTPNIQKYNASTNHEVRQNKRDIEQYTTVFPQDYGTAQQPHRDRYGENYLWPQSQKMTQQQPQAPSQIDKDPQRHILNKQQGSNSLSQGGYVTSAHLPNLSSNAYGLIRDDIIDNETNMRREQNYSHAPSNPSIGQSHRPKKYPPDYQQCNQNQPSSKESTHGYPQDHSSRKRYSTNQQQYHPDHKGHYQRSPHSCHAMYNKEHATERPNVDIQQYQVINERQDTTNSAYVTKNVQQDKNRITANNITDLNQKHRMHEQRRRGRTNDSERPSLEAFTSYKNVKTSQQLPQVPNQILVGHASMMNQASKIEQVSKSWPQGCYNRAKNVHQNDYNNSENQDHNGHQYVRQINNTTPGPVLRSRNKIYNAAYINKSSDLEDKDNHFLSDVPETVQKQIQFKNRSVMKQLNQATDLTEPGRQHLQTSADLQKPHTGYVIHQADTQPRPSYQAEARAENQNTYVYKRAFPQKDDHTEQHVKNVQLDWHTGRVHTKSNDTVSFQHNQHDTEKMLSHNRPSVGIFHNNMGQQPQCYKLNKGTIDLKMHTSNLNANKAQTTQSNVPEKWSHRSESETRHGKGYSVESNILTRTDIPTQWKDPQNNLQKQLRQEGHQQYKTSNKNTEQMDGVLVVNMQDYKRHPQHTTHEGRYYTGVSVSHATDEQKMSGNVCTKQNQIDGTSTTQNNTIQRVDFKPSKHNNGQEDLYLKKKEVHHDIKESSIDHGTLALKGSDESLQQTVLRKANPHQYDENVDPHQIDILPMMSPQGTQTNIFTQSKGLPLSKHAKCYSQKHSVEEGQQQNRNTITVETDNILPISLQDWHPYGLRKKCDNIHDIDGSIPADHEKRISQQKILETAHNESSQIKHNTLAIESGVETLSTECHLSKCTAQEEPYYVQMEVYTEDHTAQKHNGRENLAQIESIGVLDQVMKQDADPCSSSVDVPNGMMTLVSRFGLSNYFPGKISTQDVTAITLQHHSQNKTAFDIPWVILRRLLMNDYHSRDAILSEFCTYEDVPLSQECGRSHSDDTPDGDFEVNPLDMLIMLLNSADIMLKQAIFERLFHCKLAVPLVYPDDRGKHLFSITSMRSIVASWKSDQTITEVEVVTHPFNIVSFIRLNRPSLSKSKLLDVLLSEQVHPTFLHYDCPLGMTSRIVADDLIEAAWFLPSGRESNGMEKEIMFLNLRGAFKRRSPQADFLLQNTSVLVVIVNIEDISLDAVHKDIHICHERVKKIVILFTSESSQPKGLEIRELYTAFKNKSLTMKPTASHIFSFHNGKIRSLVDIKRQLQNAINKQIADSKPNLRLDLLQTANINVGHSLKSHGMETLANCFIECMNKYHVGNIRKDLLPLQGDLLHQLCELSRKADKSTQEKQIQIIRQQQRKICDSIQEIMVQFVNILQASHLLKSDKLILLDIVKFEMDRNSRKVLPDLRRHYHEQWQRYRASSRTGAKSNKPDYLVEAEHNLKYASVGPEHLLREIGQIFEASKNAKTEVLINGIRIDKLPENIAKIMYAGYPIEIMDGDACYVPFDWLSAVFASLNSITHNVNTKLCVLSVLGLQSSGKSTLLNTMFGTRFITGAGRSTKGAFMQLVPVRNPESFPFAFFLVIDVEGFKSQELCNMDQRHDSELAALAIGLGDITIINIKGEGTAEVSDALKVAVQTYIRLYQRQHLQKTCYFVHQNVAAVNAKEKLMFSSMKLRDALDEMTQDAATEEGISLTSITEMVNFDVSKHIHYIPDLWEGSPPMAPVNPGYSTKVDELREALITEAAQYNTYSSIGDFAKHIEILWTKIISREFNLE